MNYHQFLTQFSEQDLKFCLLDSQPVDHLHHHHLFKATKTCNSHETEYCAFFQIITITFLLLKSLKVLVVAVFSPSNTLHFPNWNTNTWHALLKQSWFCTMCFGIEPSTTVTWVVGHLLACLFQNKQCLTAIKR